MLKASKILNIFRLFSLILTFNSYILLSSDQKFFNDIKTDFSNDSDFQNLLKTAATNGADTDEVKQIKDIALQKVQDTADSDGIDQNSDTFNQAIQNVNSTIDQTLKIDPKTGKAKQQSPSEWASAKKYFGEGVGMLGTGLTVYQGYEMAKGFINKKNPKSKKKQTEEESVKKNTPSEESSTINKQSSGKQTQEENSIKQKEQAMEKEASIKSAEQNLSKEESSKIKGGSSEEDGNFLENEHLEI
jgi:hypothetical protein